MKTKILNNNFQSQHKGFFDGRTYSPRHVEIELTHTCNLRCDGCAILADIEKNQHTLDYQTLIEFISQLSQNSFEAISLTGGEPFIDYQRLKRIIVESELPVFKINTNGFIFSSYDAAKNVLSELKSIGLGSGQVETYLMISIGQQNTSGVPLQNSIWAAQAFEDVYGLSNPSMFLGFNVFHKFQPVADRIARSLIELYEQTLEKKFDMSKIQIRMIPAGGVHCSTAHKIGNKKVETMYLKDLLYKQLYEDEASPPCYPEMKNPEESTGKMLLRADGKLYACSGFAHVYQLGSIYTDSIDSMLTIARKHTPVETVYSQGLLGLYKKAVKMDPSIQFEKLPVSSGPCDICRRLSMVTHPKFHYE